MANPAKTTEAYRFQYVTENRYLVAALISNGVRPTLVTKSQKGECYYIFDQTSKIVRLLDNYRRKTIKVNMDYFDLVCEMSYEPYTW